MVSSEKETPKFGGIKVVFSDNEGCIIPGKGQPLPLKHLDNLRSLIGSLGIPFGICTGRSIPYMEAMAQVLGLEQSECPFICEGGAILYYPGRDTRGQEPGELLCHASAELALRQLPADVRANCYVEYGKVACLSLYPIAGLCSELLFEMVQRSTLGGSFNVTKSAAAVDITPVGVDKATGLTVVLHRLGFSQDEVLCVGDSTNDLPMLRMAGTSACPSNASPDVRAVVDYVASRPATEGLIEILRHFFERERHVR